MVKSKETLPHFKALTHKCKKTCKICPSYKEKRYSNMICNMLKAEIFVDIVVNKP